MVCWECSIDVCIHAEDEVVDVEILNPRWWLLLQNNCDGVANNCSFVVIVLMAASSSCSADKQLDDVSIMV